MIQISILPCQIIVRNGSVNSVADKKNSGDSGAEVSSQKQPSFHLDLSFVKHDYRRNGRVQIQTFSTNIYVYNQAKKTYLSSI